MEDKGFRSREGCGRGWIDGNNNRKGLVVMGDDPCLRGCGFESRPHVLDGNDILSH